MFKFPQEIEDLPIYSSLNSVCEKILHSPSRFLILTAETGAGKSTALPIALLNNFSGNIVMVEPRRIAAVNIAERVSYLIGEKTGETCGYAIHLENKTSEKTRFTAVTDAVLTKKLQENPLLDDINVIVIDEFHERSAYNDLNMAFLMETMSLREDLFVVIMSATINTIKLKSYLEKTMGTDSVPVISISGKLYPVKIDYNGYSSIKSVVLNEINCLNNGSVLVFLPGINEIRKFQNELSQDTDCDILVLHSSVPIEEQKQILSKSKTKRIILSSAIAETSLTVPDVKVVIDSGESRYNLFNSNLGMNTLITRRISEFNAKQRTGRAGRTSSGKCIRLWNENELLLEEIPPEILRADLTDIVLECAEWGNLELDKINFLDKPNIFNWKNAVLLLEELNCLKNNKITNLGQLCLELGLGVRLGCVVLSGLSTGNIELSTGCALNFIHNSGSSLNSTEKWASKVNLRVQKIAKRVQNLQLFPAEFTHFSTGCALLCGFPDRFAQRVSENKNEYQFPSGRIAQIAKELSSYPLYIVCPNVLSGERIGKIFEYEVLTAEESDEFLKNKAETYVKVFFLEYSDKSSIQKVEYKAYGKIILSKKKLKCSYADYIKAVCSAVSEKGLNFLPLSKKSENFLLRVQFYIENMGTDLEDLSDKFKNLAQNAEEWLIPFLPEGNHLNEESVFQGLFWYLDGENVIKKVPAEIVLENGKKRKLIYEKVNGTITPVLEIIIQHIFGCFSTPEVCGKKVLLKLLSPARRPLQITDDLESFWKTTWNDICKEMKGRYPKHNWNYKIVTDE